MTRTLSTFTTGTRRALRQERLELLFGTAATESATEPSTAATPPQQFTDPALAAAARESLSGQSATFLKQSRQTRGE
jgi:hypothetical protein